MAASNSTATRTGEKHIVGDDWATLNADGSVLRNLSVADQAVASLGAPLYTSCCPTGTIEYSGAKTNLQCNAVETTIKAMTQTLSTHPPKFLIIYGSLRKMSCSRRLAVEAARILAGYGAEVKIFDPSGLPLFSMDADPKSLPKVVELRALVSWCEGMIWVSPEIHGNMSGVFKNQVDWMPLKTGAIRPTQGKTCAVMQVNAGSQSFNTVNNLRVLGRWMRMIVIPNQASIPKAWTEFSEDGSLKDTSFRSRVVDVVDELFKFTSLLRDQQPYFIQRFSEQKDASAQYLKETAQVPVEKAILQSLQDPVILDVRSAKEASAEKGGKAIEGSFHVPLDFQNKPQSAHVTTVEEFRMQLTAAGMDLFSISKHKDIITHCTAYGTDCVGRGARAAALLRVMGYVNAHNGGSADVIRAAGFG